MSDRTAIIGTKGQTPMLAPDEMARRYGLRWGALDRHATPRQRRRLRHKLRRIYGMLPADRDAWIAAARERGQVIR